MVCKTCGGNSGPSPVALPLSNPPSTSCSECTPLTAPGCEAFCEEDHVATTIYKKYGYTLRAKTSFVWPALNETVTFTVEGVDRLAPGTLLWNPDAGYLHVVSFDFANQTVVAKNEGEVCNTYSGGETLPECSDFIVGPPVCISGSGTPLSDIPYLAADFIAPENTACALASVTNITGLTLNDIVSVNGYEYRIGEVIDSNTISLCNDGSGAPTGTVISWDDDADSIPNIPLFVTSSENPCTRTGISSGIILACDGADASRPLTGSVDGQIPVWNNILSKYELKNISVPYTTCTALTADLTVDPLHVGSYLILVVSSAAFTTGMAALIGGLFYIVNVVDNSTTMHVTPVVTPGAIATYPAGSSVCAANEAFVIASLQGLASDRLVGRDSPGTGVPEQLIVTGGLEFTGAGGIQRSALTGDVTAALGSNTMTLAPAAASRKVRLMSKGLYHVAGGAAVRATEYGDPVFSSVTLMPYPGVITAVTLLTFTALVTGGLNVELYKNGIFVATLTTLNAPNYSVATIITPVPFVAGDFFELWMSNNHTPTPINAFTEAWGYFTA